MPPNTVWSSVSMLTVGPPRTVIVTLSLAVAPSLSVTVKVRVTTWSCRRCTRRRPGRIFYRRVTERPHIAGGGP